MKFEDFWISGLAAGGNHEGPGPIPPAVAARLAWDGALKGSAFQVTLNKLERDKAGKGYPYLEAPP